MSIFFNNPALYILIPLLISLLWCGSPDKDKATSGDNCWLNNDSYVIKTSGSPKNGETGIDKRKKQSLNAAKKNARDEIMKRFTYNPGYEEVQFEDPAVRARIEVLGDIVKSGTVISDEYDSEQSCRITYSVTSIGLKARVETLYSGREETLYESGDTKKTAIIKYPDSETEPFKYLGDNQGAFFSGDLYIFKCTGNPGKNEKDAGRRKSQARQSAILLSQYNIIKIIYDRKIEFYGGSENEYDNRYRQFYKELTEIVKTGTVLNEKFDSEQNCTILFQVKRKGFHKWAEQPL